jgi:hypothetical protein
MSTALASKKNAATPAIALPTSAMRRIATAVPPAALACPQSMWPTEPVAATLRERGFPAVSTSTGLARIALVTLPIALAMPPTAPATRLPTEVGMQRLEPATRPIERATR